MSITFYKLLCCISSSAVVGYAVQDPPQLDTRYRAQVDLASVEVRFENLSVSAEVAVGARGEPTVLNAFRNSLEVILKSSAQHCSPCNKCCRPCQELDKSDMHTAE